MAAIIARRNKRPLADLLLDPGFKRHGTRPMPVGMGFARRSVSIGNATGDDMAGGSTLDPDNLPDPAPARGAAARAEGSDTGSLGPSDSTDSGSDVAGGIGHFAGGAPQRFRQVGHG